MSMMHVVKDLPSHFRFYPAGTSVSIAGYTLSDLYDYPPFFVGAKFA